MTKLKDKINIKPQLDLNSSLMDLLSTWPKTIESKPYQFIYNLLLDKYVQMTKS